MTRSFGVNYLPIVDRPVFFLDYDGTLAPIVTEPMEAFPHPDLPEILSQLASSYPTWIVTGRDLHALGGLLPIRLPAVGLHGIEWGEVGLVEEERIEPDAREAIGTMRARVPAGDGIVIEEKGALFAVHYRRSADPDAARKELDEWAQEAPASLVVIHGKFVVELRPRGVSKGTVVDELAERHPERTPIFIGDDATDEDAFEVLRDRGVCIKVGPGATQAAFRLESVGDVVKYLKEYVR